MTLLKELVARQHRVVSVSPMAVVRDAAKAMAEANVGCVAVMEGDRLVGLFTERDLLRRVLLQNLDVDKVQMSEVMTKEVVCAKPDDRAHLAAKLMHEHHIRHLPVVDEDTLLGILSIRDLIREEVQELRDYIAQRDG